MLQISRAGTAIVTVTPFGSRETALSTLRGVWPGVEIDHERVLAWLDARGAVHRSPERIADLYLACAACAHDAAALRHLERCHFPAIRQTITSRLRGTSTDADDVLQELRQRLVVGTGHQRPLLEKFEGRGPLHSWLRIVAARYAARAPARSERALVRALETPTSDPELDYLRRNYEAEFRSSLSAALDALSPRERALLQMRVVSRLTPEDIAGLYRVHRTTVIRWLARARQTLHSTLRRSLMRQLGVSRSGVSSILRLVDSTLPQALQSRLRAGLAR